MPKQFKTGDFVQLIGDGKKEYPEMAEMTGKVVDTETFDVDVVEVEYKFNEGTPTGIVYEQIAVKTAHLHKVSGLRDMSRKPHIIQYYKDDRRGSVHASAVPRRGRR